MVIIFQDIVAEASSVSEIINYEIIRGNPAWRFVLVLLGILLTMMVGRIAQFAADVIAKKQCKRMGENAATLILKSLAKPIYVAVFAFGLNMCKLFLYFDNADGIRDWQSGFMQTSDGNV